jgi:hypothetical protein
MKVTDSRRDSSQSFAFRNSHHQKLAEDYYNHLSKQNEMLLIQQAQIEQLRQHVFNITAMYSRQQQQAQPNTQFGK